jgi:plasmid segregation protein ParM
MNDSIVVAGLDIGNGYVKGASLSGVSPSLTKHKIDIPSCAVRLVQKLEVPDSLNEELMSDIFNKVICRIDSDLVEDKLHFMFGQGAIETGHHPVEFDIADGNLSKSQQQLSATLVLGMVASSAFKDYWDANKSLPIDTISVESVVALALPIGEYVIYRESFAEQFKNKTHTVTICNFDKDITVDIRFKHVLVMPEGVSAQYAIANKGEDFIDKLLLDVRSRDEQAMKGITAKDVMVCGNTCGIDIGEGTVNFPVILNGKFNPVASTSIAMGFGTVVEQSIPAIRKQNMPWSTRKAVVNFMQQKISPLNENKKRKVTEIINSEAIDLVDAIIREVSKILRSGNVEVIYVYGGGATPLKEALYDKLVEKTKTFAGGDAFPILYLDSVYARNLNKEGLLDFARVKAGI